MDEKLLGPNVAGSWYPADRKELGSLLDGHLAAADGRDRDGVAPKSDLIALIAPHAGYAYSGPVAGAVFR